MRTSPVALIATTACLIVAAWTSPAHAQEPIKRIMAQDPSLNNLVDPSGYKTARLGTLGGVVRTGTGTQAMILIPGLGFGAGVFEQFMAERADKCRMYAVTLPGFGGTAAPPSPGEPTSFGEQTWTNAALGAIESLIKDEDIRNPIIVGHWLTGTQIALRLAMKHPGKVRAVILLAGSARMVITDPAGAAYYATLEKRVATIDTYLAPKWFKTVTRATWDDNNFLPGDYAVNPVLGLRLWRQAAAPPLHVWVRYLCEFNAQDISLEMDKVTVPTLILEPGLEGAYHDPGNDYMDAFLHKSWEGRTGSNPKITVKTIANARACPWVDQPQAVNDAVAGFLTGLD
jgi:pimeloyl-ACP methyl ester carboxylesterase